MTQRDWFWRNRTLPARREAEGHTQAVRVSVTATLHFEDYSRCQELPTLPTKPVPPPTPPKPEADTRPLLTLVPHDDGPEAA